MSKIISKKSKRANTVGSAASTKKGASRTEKSVVTITFGANTIEGTLSDLRQPEWTEKLQKRCRKKKAVGVQIGKFLSLTDEDRWAMVTLVAGLGTKTKVTIGTRPEQEGLFDAVLSTVKPGMSPGRLRAAKLAALESVAVLFRDSPEIGCSSIAQKLKEAGVEGTTASRLCRDVKQIVARVAEGNRARLAAESNTKVKSIIDDAPVSDEIVVPTGWSLTKDSVISIGDDNATAGRIPAPVVIAGRFRDERQETESFRVAWFRDEQWQSTFVSRETAATSKSIVRLAAVGFPVTSNNAAAVVQYLADFEVTNLANLPMSHISSELGWQIIGDRECFLCGRKVITCDGIVEPDEPGVGVSAMPPPLYFRGADAGDDQIAAGFHSAGTFDDWKNAISAAMDFPYARIAIYVSLSAPLLHILGLQGYVLDLASETSAGKTTALRVAGSVWGNPDESSADKPTVLMTWNSSAVCKERTPTVLKNLPMLLDDTKHARDAKEVAATIYAISQGKGRGRGSIAGLARQLTFQTLLISSGEQPITSFTQDGGTRARVLALWGPPFGERNEVNGRRVRNLNRKIKKHYGHAGPEFVLNLLRRRDQWNDWRKQYRAQVSLYASRAGNDRLGGRRAEHLAVVWLAAKLSHEFLDLPWEFADPVEDLWRELTADAGEADRAVAALKYVYEWATAHQEQFYGRESLDRSQPFDGWAGHWMQSRGNKRWKYLGFIPQKLEQILAAGKFDVDAVVRTWADRGWLISTVEKNTIRRHKKVSIAQNSVWVFAISRDALREQLRLDV